MAWAASVPWALSVAEVPAGAAAWPDAVAAPVSPSFGLFAPVELAVELPVVVPVADWLFTLWLAEVVSGVVPGVVVAAVCPLGLALCAELWLAVGAFIDDGLLCEVLAD